MARKCSISKVGKQFGHRVSHANNRTKHAFDINIQKKRIFVPELKKFVSIRATTRILRTIDKLGVSGTLKKYGMTVKDLTA